MTQRSRKKSIVWFCWNDAILILNVTSNCYDTSRFSHFFHICFTQRLIIVLLEINHWVTDYLKSICVFRSSVNDVAMLIYEIQTILSDDERIIMWMKFLIEIRVFEKRVSSNLYWTKSIILDKYASYQFIVLFSCNIAVEKIQNKNLFDLELKLSDEKCWLLD